MLLWFLGLYWFQMHTHAEFFVLTKSSVYIHVFMPFCGWFYAIIMILTKNKTHGTLNYFSNFRYQFFIKKIIFQVCHEFQFFGKTKLLQEAIHLKVYDTLKYWIFALQNRRKYFSITKRKCDTCSCISLVINLIFTHFSPQSIVAACRKFQLNFST